jgi:hypothetical protein
MAKKIRKNMEGISLRMGYKIKAHSHTGNQGLVPSLCDENIMVTKKIYTAQKRRRG